MTATAATDVPRRAGGQRREYTSPGLSLGTAFRIFVGYLNPRVIAAMLIAASVVRLTIGGWGWSDLEVAGAILLLEPFTEWVTHITVLHLRPVRIGGRTVDLYVAKRHRWHHQDPKVIEHVLIPKGVVIRLVVFALPVFYFAAPTLPDALTGLVTSYAMLLTYEWTHFLIHSTYTPKTWYYRYIWRAHRLHHYKNENYWYGVTVHVADHILRTFPERDAVETSPTARTLGVNAA